MYMTNYCIRVTCKDSFKVFNDINKKLSGQKCAKIIFLVLTGYQYGVGVIRLEC